MAGVVAAAVGLAGAVLVSDGVDADEGTTDDAAATIQAVPVLAGDGDGSALSSAVSEYGVAAFSSGTRRLVLSGWGAAFADLFADDAPAAAPDAVLVADPRTVEPAGERSFADPCAEEPEASGCTGDGPRLAARVLGDEAPGPNAVFLYPFPQSDVALARECAFVGTSEELALAVITTNPGEVVVRLGDAVTTVASDDDQREEYEAWRRSGSAERPIDSFVAHCLAVDRPRGIGADEVLDISATATDDAGQVATATVTLLPAVDGALPVTVTPIDGTMVRVDVPLRPGGSDASVLAVPLADAPFGCDPAPAEPTGPEGWRRGTSVLASQAIVAGERPYLDGFSRVRRVTVALPEGEPSLLCVLGLEGAGTTGAVLTPPDARRLRLAVTGAEVGSGLDDGAVTIAGTFASLGWIACGGALPALEPGGPGAFEVVLCDSGGDSGAIAAAGGVLDLQVANGTAAHLARIALDATPGGPARDTYRIPIPAAGFDGTLCTEGADQPGCVAPEGDAVAGALVVVADWTEGPAGPAAWSIVPVGAAPPVPSPGTPGG
jgi:hypothetical protein